MWSKICVWAGAFYIVAGILTVMGLIHPSLSWMGGSALMALGYVIMGYSEAD